MVSCFVKIGRVGGDWKFRFTFAPTLVPLLKFYFHEEVRKVAVSGNTNKWLALHFYPTFLFWSLLHYFILLGSLSFWYSFGSSHVGATALSKISYREGACSRSKWDLYKAVIWLHSSSFGWSIAQGNINVKLVSFQVINMFLLIPCNALVEKLT